MFELSSEVPFLWRLSPESSDGYCSVSMVVPCPPETQVHDLTIETNVQSLSSDSTRSETEETLEWNQEDIELFLKLVNRHQLRINQPLPETLRVDLTDPEIIDIINLVAAAGFGVAFASDGLIQRADGSFPVHQFDVGSLASINTVSGFKPCIVVDLENDDVVCVLLEDIEVQAGLEHDHLSRHDLLLVKRIDILHPEFAECHLRPEDRLLH
ncbi:MAG TPA: hypothetical protein DD672_10745 [Gammaproteobacteria bacterium]|nr:hypothetical protein [Gammaproteobacteria bacterium]RPG45534.1 MAG: hypothetical protein CBD23_003785 [Gammaproteobacteria bacterium TMED163]HAO88109.1 hypothetical protein [Gammaproteobacteria bacterium]HAU24290.1 hypothetical protein [Gammaproteobacteria bacterium]HBQ00941.1 hypothetical protein [Gammaproteobacteria bacterium]|tara:strand:+ start:1723 stop:2358 length:636 start_codon:yes stop_codon:yes gene_type:complete